MPLPTRQPLHHRYSFDRTVPGGGNADQYLDFVWDTVLPRVAEWSGSRLLTGAQHTSMLGSSLGGLLSCYAGWTRPSALSKVGCMSSSFWWNSQDFNGTVLQRPTRPGPSQLQVYLDSGNSGAGPFCSPADADDCVETVTVRDRLEELGWVTGKDLYYYLDVGGRHSEAFWGRRFHLPLLALFGVGQGSAPARGEEGLEAR